jgi:hypothetical protein
MLSLLLASIRGPSRWRVDYITEHTHQRAAARAGHSFEGRVSYASTPEKAEWVRVRSVMSVETAAIEMEEVAARSLRDPNCGHRRTGEPVG